jgi:HEAT repeat protein
MTKPKILPSEIYQRIEEFGLKTSVDMLTDIIELDKDDKKRIESIKYLALISNNSAAIRNECYDTFESILVSEDKVGVRCEAAKALGTIKHEKGLEPLKWVLEQNQINNQTKFSVLNAIRKIRFQEPEVQLFIKELDSNIRSIREYVSIQLLSLNPENLIPVLLNSLKNKESSNQHKIELVKLLGLELSSINISSDNISDIIIDNHQILTNLIQNKINLLDIITLILREEDKELMNSAITILTLLEEEIETNLIKLVLIDDFRVKKNAIVLIGKLKLKNAVDLLIANLDNIYNEVVIASIESLSEIGDMSAVPELINILDIEDISFEFLDFSFYSYILDAVKKIYMNNKDAPYDYLYASLAKDNDIIKESIAYILGELGKEEFVGPLIDLLSVRNLDVRKNTIIALGKIGSIEALEPLLKILDDDNSYWLIKKVTVDAIYNIFQNNWYRIKDDEKEIRRLLNKNITKLVDHLGKSEDENFKVKLSLIRLLETYGDDHSLSGLLKRVNDFHRIVRIRASNAIKRIQERLELENN